MVTMASQRQNEFELHARAILGLPVDTSLSRPSGSAVIYGNHDADGILFENIDQALTVPESDLRLFGKPISFKRRRMGVALASADNVSEARTRAQKVASLVKTSV
jgi:phosphoribosylglycinamide formyltransferase 2